MGRTAEGIARRKARDRECQRRKRAARETHGLCYWCGLKAPESGFKTCDSCRKSRRTAVRKARVKSVSGGTCPTCGRASRPGRVLCSRCAARNSANRGHGASLEYRENLFAQQSGLCAICQAELGDCLSAHMDHSHETGKLRGLLCGKCNAGIGQFDDTPERLKAAASYLEAHLA